MLQETSECFLKKCPFKLISSTNNMPIILINVFKMLCSFFLYVFRKEVFWELETKCFHDKNKLQEVYIDYQDAINE